MARPGQGCKVTGVWWRRPEPQVPFNRVEVVNPSDGGFFHWLIKFYVFGALCLAGALFLGGLATYAYFSYRLPQLPDIARYEHEAAESTRAARPGTAPCWPTGRPSGARCSPPRKSRRC